MRRPIPPFSVIMLAASLALAPPAAAQVRGATVLDDGTFLSTGAWNLGRAFTVTSATSVVSLGLWDHLGNGLVNAHQVGLWASNGALLYSVSVAAGTGAVLDGNFRFVDIAPIALTVGSSYLVAATYAGVTDDWYMVDATFTSAPMITYDAARWEYGGALAFPSQVNGNSTGYWGGDVRLASVVATPEPGTLSLMGLGVTGMFALRRRRPRG